MRLLVIGGTSFVGRHLVEAAVAAGDEVTLANRGRTGADLFPDLERRTIDRTEGDLRALAGQAGGRWDATVDVCGYVPRHVTQLLSALGDRAGRYVFVSTGSVYANEHLDEDDTEDARRWPPAWETEDVDGETYGPLKVACEDVAIEERRDEATVVRPGIVAGPYDPTDRFTWWPRCLARGDAVPVPDRRDQPVQVVDARDLGAFLRLVAADDVAGTFNAVGDRHTVEAFARAVATGVGPPAGSVEWIDRSWLAAQGAAVPPLVLDPAWGIDGLFSRRNERAKAAGFHVRPLGETAADTLAWDRRRGLPPLQAGPSLEDAAALVAAWRSRSAAAGDHG